MLRRFVRNRAAVLFPNSYRQRIERIRNRIPLLDQEKHVTASTLGLIEFYRNEYAEMAPGVPEGLIELHGREVSFQSPLMIDWKIHIDEEGDHQMWRVKLAHMGFLAPLILGEEGRLESCVADVIKSASACSMTERGAFSGFWFPYAASHRVLAICSALIGARSRKIISAELARKIEDFLKLNVAFILDNIEYELINNHTERNLAALCLYFSYTTEVPEHIRKALEAGVAEVVAKTILPDGTQGERSPMYQVLSEFSLAVMADSHFLSPGLRSRLVEMHQKAKLATRILRHPDGEVSLFNDSWMGEVPRSPVDDQGLHGRHILSAGGYARIGNKQDVCILDAGPLGLIWNPGHGHSDFLSVEISLCGTRFIVDPGTSRYNTGPERSRERSLAAHNGPVWTGYEPVQFYGSFKVGKLRQASLVQTALLPSNVIGGFFQCERGRLIRLVQRHPQAGFLITDYWGSTAPGSIGFLIPANWECGQTKRGEFLFRTNTEQVYLSSLEAESALIFRDEHAFHYGEQRPATKVAISAAARGAHRIANTWVGRVPATSDTLRRAERNAELIETINFHLDSEHRGFTHAAH